MSLDPLRQAGFHQDVLINASAGSTSNQAPAPMGMGATGSTLGSCGACCSSISERLIAVKDAFVDFCVRVKNYITNYFFPVPPPTPELIRQTFGEEIRYMLENIFCFLSICEGEDSMSAIEQHREGVRAQIVAMFDIYPEMVRLNIQNKMEELKREANPDVRFVDNWAQRVLRGQIQYPWEEAPIATAEEMNIIDPNNFFRRAIDSLIQGVGGLPEQQAAGQVPPEAANTLRIRRTEIPLFNFTLFINQHCANSDPNLARAIRDAVVRGFDRLPEAVQNQVKARMVEIAASQSAEVGEIPNWAERVIHGEVRIPGEVVNRPSIERHIDILAPEGVYFRAMTDVINATPLPQPAQA